MLWRVNIEELELKHPNTNMRRRAWMFKEQEA